MKKIERMDIIRATGREVDKMIEPMYRMLEALEAKHGLELIEERLELSFGLAPNMKRALSNARLRSF